MLRKGYAGESLVNLPAGAVIAAQAASSTRAVVNGTPRTFVWQTAPLTGWRVVIGLP